MNVDYRECFMGLICQNQFSFIFSHLSCIFSLFKGSKLALRRKLISPQYSNMQSEIMQMPIKKKKYKLHFSVSVAIVQLIQ